MNADEKRAERFLREQGHRIIVFEPDGNVPPDFLVNHQIAIEVTRLEQQHNGVGIEVDSRPIEDAVSAVLSEFDMQFVGRSYFIWLRIRRPVPSVRAVKETLRKVLTDFLANPTPVPTELISLGRCGVKIFPAQTVSNKVFLPGGGIDLDDGGFLIPEMVENISRCSDEKAGKVRPYLQRYPAWELILIDHIAFGVSDEEQRAIREQVTVDLLWRSIIVVSAEDTRVSFRLEP